MTPTFPVFVFLVRDLTQHNSIAYTHHYMCNLKIVSQQVQTRQKPLGCVAVGCVASRCCEAKVSWIGNLCGRVRSQRHSNHFMPTLEKKPDRSLPSGCLKAHPHHSADIINYLHLLNKEEPMKCKKREREQISQRRSQRPAPPWPSAEFCQHVTAAVQASERTTDA